MNLPLTGITALVTSGATREPLDPVRYITNHSSGKQGYAIAEALAEYGAHVTLISGITALPCPAAVTRIITPSAEEMLAACLHILPVTIAICAAAVADFRPLAVSPQKIKKDLDSNILQLTLIKNPDILATLANHPTQRPPLVIGFAAETEDIVKNARDKLQRKGCDWILANDVSGDVFNSDTNSINFLTAMSDQHEHWPTMSKKEVAERLVEKIIRDHL